MDPAKNLVMGRQAQIGQHGRYPLAEARPAFGDALGRGAVGFGEQHVIADGRRPVREEPVGHRGHVAARPWPLPVGVECRLVDID